MEAHEYRILIGEAIRHERKRQGLSQRKLADMVGTTQSHLWSIEHGAVSVGIDLICRIAEALDIQLASLFDF